MGPVKLSRSIEVLGLSPEFDWVKEERLLCSSLPTKEDDSREGLNGLWCWSKLLRVIESIEGRDVVPVPPVSCRLWVEVDDGLEGGRADGCFSSSPHSVGGGDEGAEAICRRVGRFGTRAVPFTDVSLEEGGLKTRG